MKSMIIPPTVSTIRWEVPEHEVYSVLPRTHNTKMVMPFANHMLPHRLEAPADT